MRNVLVLMAVLAAAPAAGAADQIHYTLTGPNSVTFDWRGPESTIRYGLTPAYGNTVTASTPDPVPYSAPGPFWEARLTGLLPNATYHYSIGNGPNHTFRTMAARGTTFTIYAQGDVGDTSHYARVGPVQSLVAAGKPLFVFMLGDLTYGDDKGPEAVNNHFNNVMKWSQDAAYMPIWGNHEWGSSSDDMRNYKGRFDLPNSQASPGAPSAGCCGEDWYWFECGNVRFIAYPEPYSGAWSDWRERVEPLMTEAQADPGIRFIVTFGHRPAYSSGHHSGSSKIKDHLDALGERFPKYVLNLNGHSHNYERSHPQSGVTHVTVGIGGSSMGTPDGPCMYDGGCPAPAWSAFRARRHGALRLTFSPNAILGEAICGPPGDGGTNMNDIDCVPGSVFDSFLITMAETVGVEARGPVLGLALESVQPNPSAGAVQVVYRLEQAGPVRLELVSAAGRAVRREELGAPGQGRHQTVLRTRGITPGVYWVRLTQAEQTVSRKLVLVP